MSNESAIVEQIATIGQDCIQRNPVVILGSGASVAHGFRSMSELAQYLRDYIQTDVGEESDAWLLIRTALSQGEGLEEALLKNAAPPSLVSKIVKLTWQAIAEDDFKLMERSARGIERFGLATLLGKLFKSTHMVANIVTTNYDRVAEYASDLAGYFHTSGFTPGLIQRRQGSEIVSLRRGTRDERTVRIWKVHGSLDWFADSAGQVLGLPALQAIPDGLDPQIVTPGVSKYERTYDEPFRSAIQGADRVLEQAQSFLSVGFGFRDRHIQPKIAERCKQQNVPIVILARTLTEEAKTFLNENAGNAYLALEKCDAGTTAFTPEHPNGIQITTPDLWSFSGFNQLIL